MVHINAIADNSGPRPWEFEERDPHPDPEPWEFYDDSYSLPWTYDDGGRAAIAPRTDPGIGDFVTRAIAIATGRPYAEVYDMVDKFGRAAGYLGIACLGVPDELADELMSEITGWRWVPLHNAHFVTSDLPNETRLIARIHGHWFAVIDGVIHDIDDCVWEDDGHERRARVKDVYLPPCEPGGSGAITPSEPTLEFDDDSAPCA
jgi:hypothetical protein